MVEIRAADFIHPDGLIVASGEMLARKVIEVLRTGEKVLIQLRGLPGISSSYFNVLLLMVQAEVGPDALDRLQWDLVWPIQRQIYERSLEAARKAYSEHR